LPPLPIVDVPGSATLTVFVGGSPPYVVVLPSHGSCASSTYGATAPDGPFRKRSNHLTASPK